MGLGLVGQVREQRPLRRVDDLVVDTAVRLSRVEVLEVQAVLDRQGPAFDAVVKALAGAASAGLGTVLDVVVLPELPQPARVATVNKLTTGRRRIPAFIASYKSSPFEHRQEQSQDAVAVRSAEVDSIANADEPSAGRLNSLEHRYRLLKRAPEIPESRHHQPVALPRLHPLQRLTQ